MSNQIKFYHTDDRPGKLDKTLSNERVLEGGFLRDMDVHNPVLRLNETAIDTDSNVAYIPRFKRWYLIDRRAEISQGTVELQLKCDYLMSFKETVRNSTVRLAESSNYDRNAKGIPIGEASGATVVKSTVPSPFIESGVYILVVANNKGGI